MKKRSAYWWLFILSGAVWAVGGAGLVTGMILYPDSNLLGGFGLVFGPIAWIGSGVFQIVLVVWLIHKLTKWLTGKRNSAEGKKQLRPNKASYATSEPAPGADSSAHQG